MDGLMAGWLDGCLASLLAGWLAGLLAVWLAVWLVGLTPRHPPDTFQIARAKVDSAQPGA